MAKKNKKNTKNGVKLHQVDVKTVRNDELKHAIEQLRNERTRENEVKMFEAMQKAHFLCPVQFAAQAPNLQLRFVMINTPDGKAFFPAFTDFEEATRMPGPESGQREFIVRSLKEYEPIFQETRGQGLGIVVNPFSGNIVLPRDLISRLNSEKAANIGVQAPAEKPAGTIPAGMEVRFDEPRIYPTALVNAVYDVCCTIPEISRVWFKQMMIGPTANFALIVESDSYGPEMEQKIRDVAEPLAKEVPVVIMKLDPILEKNAVKNTIALYDRELSV